MHAPRLRIHLVAIATLALATTAHAAPLDSLLRKHSADQLVEPLRRFENQSRPREGAQAAMLLGHLHYARGEYRRAAEAFGRAAARLDPAGKPEARYWSGLAWLALGDHGRARAALEEVGPADARSADARLALAIAWEGARRPDEALEILEPLARRGDASEAMPAILDHALTLAERLHRRDLASFARDRLLREYPRSMEAARVGRAAAASGAAVDLGPYPSEPRAHAVADQARRAGFASARAVIRGEGDRRAYLVRLGEFPTETEAQQAADRARRELNAPARVVAR